MNLLCVLWSHRYVTVANPGEEPYQWCRRCRHYRATAADRDAHKSAGPELRPGLGPVDFGGNGAHGGVGGGFDGGGGN
jgi:hypothetical protein